MAKATNNVKGIFGSYIMNTRELTWIKEDHKKKKPTQQELFQMVEDYIEEA